MKVLIGMKKSGKKQIKPRQQDQNRRTARYAAGGCQWLLDHGQCRRRSNRLRIARNGIVEKIVRRISPFTIRVETISRCR